MRRPETGGAGGRGGVPRAAVARAAGATVPPMPQTTSADGATREANVARRRRMATIVLAAVVVLFAVQLTALALGWLEVSFAIFAVIIAGWFALRSYQKRYPI